MYQAQFCLPISGLRFKDRFQCLTVLDVIHNAAVRINVIAAILRVVSVINPFLAGNSIGAGDLKDVL